ncbi:MAG TPA: hypothetical protein VFP89_15930 [Propionibacteriaceae bacterium]|nr:hypothetical protein [Propionibacteriaceae bacterium]
MAQEQKARKQPQDPYAQRGKTLASSVQRLRGWVGSDPSRAPELADALVELTAHRLRGHAYSAAAADAQEAVRRAAQQLTANGPIGPYTSVKDAARYTDAVVHLATIQAGLGLPEASGRTLESLQPMQQQLSELGLEQLIKPETAVWALSCTARAALAAGEVAEANAYADATLSRLAGSEVKDQSDGAYIAIDAERLASDCRWAAGKAAESLAHLHTAKDLYERAAAERLREPGRLSPALLERLAEPLFGLYRDMADRLIGSDELELGLATRHTLVERLQGLAGRLGDPGRRQLASALTDLANDLLAADRLNEADEAASEAAKLALDRSGAEVTRLLITAARARVLTRMGRSGEAVALLRQQLPAETAASVPAAHVVGLLALADALRAGGDLDAATSTERALDALAQDLVGPAANETNPRMAVQDLARGVVSRGSQPIPWSPLATTLWHAPSPDALDGQAAAETEPVEDATAWLESERAEAHRLEQERLIQARIEADRRETERVEAERLKAERVAAERARAEEARRFEEERRATAEEMERLERKRRREERLEAHRLEMEQREADRLAAEQAVRDDAERAETGPAALEDEEAERVEAERAETERLEAERAEAQRLEAERVEAERVEAERGEAERPEPAQPSELTVAQQEWREAKAQGDRRRARAANERVVELLRPRAEEDLIKYGPQLQYALEELSSGRLRSGDLWGSRAPAKEAKALAKALGR